MKRRTISLLALILAAVMTLGLAMNAAAMDDNPVEGIVHVGPEDTMKYNQGTVSNNEGTVEYNKGTVSNNDGTVEYNEGTVKYNEGTVEYNEGTVKYNDGTVEINKGTVENNFRIVVNNERTVENNDGIVVNNYGTVEDNYRIVENNYGGSVIGGSVTNQFYELPTPQNFSYTDATESNDKWWIKSDATVTVTANEGFYFASAPTTTSGTVTVKEEGKSYTLSNVTGNLTNGGLTLDVQAETTEPDPTPTTPPTDNTAEQPAAPTVQKMETAERPDPMDVEATERYNFWMDVKSDLRAAGDGKTMRIHVPADYTNMPASVMEQIRLLDKEITVDLRWGGERLLITPETAQRKTALKAFWTFEQLCELYAQ